MCPLLETNVSLYSSGTFFRGHGLSKQTEQPQKRKKKIHCQLGFWPIIALFWPNFPYSLMFDTMNHMLSSKNIFAKFIDLRAPCSNVPVPLKVTLLSATTYMKVNVLLV